MKGSIFGDLDFQGCDADEYLKRSTYHLSSTIGTLPSGGDGESIRSTVPEGRSSSRPVSTSPFPLLLLLLHSDLSVYKVSGPRNTKTDKTRYLKSKGSPAAWLSG